MIATEFAESGVPSGYGDWDLCPAQLEVRDKMLEALDCCDAIVLGADPGMGRTSMLEAVQRERGGLLIGMRGFMSAVIAGKPEALEEAFLSLALRALEDHNLLLFDDLQLLVEVFEGMDYPRPNLFDAALTALFQEAQASGTKLVFGVESGSPAPIRARARRFDLEEFTPADYEAICRAHLGEDGSKQIDYDQLHGFCPALNGYRLKNACAWMRLQANIGTDAIIDFLRQEYSLSNVAIEEVEKVTWDDLKGLDDIVRELECKIALPLENPELAAELQLRPKRGVLLVGPPGTGKTTIGRALAHRLKSKFFLIDGTEIAGTNCFFRDVKRIFQDAKRNAPSIVFIDDADIIFAEEGHGSFYRYMLTILDGVESASLDRVCVVMAAMDAYRIPAAVLRSGRIELWLETRLPDETARAAILLERLAELPADFQKTDVAAVVRVTRGFSAADLKALVEDSKLGFAYDRSRGRQTRPVEEYLLQAVEKLKAGRRNLGRVKPRRVEDSRFGFRKAE
jgi:ATP-dependent 26S proteasome regulatory subunit